MQWREWRALFGRERGCMGFHRLARVEFIAAAWPHSASCSSPVQSAGGNELFFGRSFFRIRPIFPALPESAISCLPFFAPWARHLWIGGAITSRSNSNQYFLACRFSFADGGGFMSALWFAPEIGLSTQE
jgi:hypothetical protein